MRREPTKRCSRCGVTKPIDEFGVDNSRLDGRYPYCKVCRNVVAIVACRKWRAKDGGEKQRIASRNYYYANTDKQLASRRRWEKANPEKHAAEKLRWQKRRSERDPLWRMTRNIGRHVAGVLKGEKRGRRAFDMIGYAPDDLRKHVESLLQPGMTWENYGDWHLDHIRPKASFDFKNDPNAVRECWALSNLQPLWDSDNRKKNSIWQGKRWATPSLSV